MREEMKVMVTVRLVGNNGNVDIEDVVATGTRDLLSSHYMDGDIEDWDVETEEVE